MGIVKHMMAEDEALQDAARDILVETGALIECEWHAGSYYDGETDLQDAYKLANSRITSRQIQLPDRISRRDFSDIIKSVYEDNSGINYCASCEKNLRD